MNVDLINIESLKKDSKDVPRDWGWGEFQVITAARTLPGERSVLSIFLTSQIFYEAWEGSFHAVNERAIAQNMPGR